MDVAAFDHRQQHYSGAARRGTSIGFLYRLKTRYALSSIARNLCARRVRYTTHNNRFARRRKPAVSADSVTRPHVARQEAAVLMTVSANAHYSITPPPAPISPLAPHLQLNPP